MDIKKLAQLYNEIKKEGGYIGFSDFGNGFHLKSEDFLKLFEIFSVREREDKKYPYELYVDVDGVEFYCIITQEKYEKLRGVDDVIAEYESKIAELKAKKEVIV